MMHANVLKRFWHFLPQLTFLIALGALHFIMLRMFVLKLINFLFILQLERQRYMIDVALI